jgi:CheY-like chemotaxis protein
LEEQFRQAQKMEAIGQLAGGVAHDFNNILLVININSEMALSSVEQGTELHSELSEIHQSAQRAASLTRQLLAFSRKQVLDKSILEVNTLIQNLEKMLLRLIGEDIFLETYYTPDLPHIFADPAQIEQVIMNLIVNARDAMPNGGELVIETKCEEITSPKPLAETIIDPGLYVTISVRDRGEGIAKEHLTRIFEPFFTTKHQGKGTGLGLSTVYGIVKQSDGYIDINSVVDFGSEFTIYFPAYDSDEKKSQINFSGNDSTNINASILLVEDEATVRNSLIAILKKKNYHVISASDGFEAVELMLSQMEPIDLLITDMIMPGMNGVELSEKITTMHPDIKTLFISGYSGNLLEHYKLSVDNVNFLHKPFMPDVLIQTIQSILSS